MSEPVLPPERVASEPELRRTIGGGAYWQVFIGCPVPTMNTRFRVTEEEWSDGDGGLPVRTISAYEVFG